MALYVVFRNRDFVFLNKHPNMYANAQSLVTSLQNKNATLQIYASSLSKAHRKNMQIHITRHFHVIQTSCFFSYTAVHFLHNLQLLQVNTAFIFERTSFIRKVLL